MPYIIGFCNHRSQDLSTSSVLNERFTECSRLYKHSSISPLLSLFPKFLPAIESSNLIKKPSLSPRSIYQSQISGRTVIVDKFISSDMRDLNGWEQNDSGLVNRSAINMNVSEDQQEENDLDEDNIISNWFESNQTTSSGRYKGRNWVRNSEGAVSDMILPLRSKMLSRQGRRRTISPQMSGTLIEETLREPYVPTPYSIPTKGNNDQSIATSGISMSPQVSRNWSFPWHRTDVEQRSSSGIRSRRLESCPHTCKKCDEAVFKEKLSIIRKEYMRTYRALGMTRTEAVELWKGMEMCKVDNGLFDALADKYKGEFTSVMEDMIAQLEDSKEAFLENLVGVTRGETR
ncbi:MAG: hypothetical protein Q9217_002603 [Psora testacea]